MINKQKMKMVFLAFCFSYSFGTAREWVSLDQGSVSFSEADTDKLSYKVQAFDADNNPVDQNNVEQIRLYRLTMKIPGFYRDRINLNNIYYDNTEIGELAKQTVDIGYPSLPYKFFMLPMSQNATFSYRATSIKSKKINNMFVAPAQHPSVDTSRSTPQPVSKNEKCYLTDKYYPVSEVVRAQKVAMRDHQFVSLEVFPFRFNPVKKILNAVYFIEIEISIVPSSQIKVNESGLGSSEFDMAMGMQSTASTMAAAANVKPVYLIVMDDQFIASTVLTNFISWKTSKGLNVQTRRTSQINTSGAPTCDQIQAAIQTFSPYPTYLLIIGDADQTNGVLPFIMTYDEGESGFRPTDLPFAYRTNTDNIPDLLYGRLPASNVTELNTMLQKVMYMDQAPLATANQFDRIIVAAKQQVQEGIDPAKTYLETADAVHTFFAKNYGSNKVWAAWVNASGMTATSPWSVTDETSMLWHGAGTTPVGSRVVNKFSASDAAAVTRITERVNSGVSILFHRDHGIGDGFYVPAFRTTQLTALTNADRLPLVLSINCSSGCYHHGATLSFGRMWLNKTNGGGTCGGGAYAFVGATSPTPTPGNERFSHGLFSAFIPGWQAWFNSDNRGLHDEVNWYSDLPLPNANTNYMGFRPGNCMKLGAIMHFGKMYTLQCYSTTDENYVMVAERYHLLGDPEANIVFQPKTKFAPLTRFLLE